MFYAVLSTCANLSLYCSDDLSGFEYVEDAKEKADREAKFKKYEESLLVCSVHCFCSCFQYL